MRGTVKITVDIETIPTQTLSTSDFLGELKEPAKGKIPSNWKDPAKIAKKAEEIGKKYEVDLKAAIVKQAEEAEEKYRRLSFDPLLAQVVCVCLAVEDNDPIQFSGEEGVIFADLEQWIAALGGSRTIRWQGQNIKGFDLPLMRLRAAKYECNRLKRSIPTKPFDGMIVDLMDLSKGTGRAMIGLDKLAKFFGVEGKTEGIDGSKVYDFWREGRIGEIVEYCRQDVRLTRLLIEALS